MPRISGASIAQKTETEYPACSILGSVFPCGRLLITPPASADPTTIYVIPDYYCSDSGPGNAGEPFCTIQGALDAVEPGQTVAIDDSYTFYETPTLTRSGTEDAPITITTVDGSDREAYI